MSNTAASASTSTPAVSVIGDLQRRLEEAERKIKEQEEKQKDLQSKADKLAEKERKEREDLKRAYAEADDDLAQDFKRRKEDASKKALEVDPALAAQIDAVANMFKQGYDAKRALIDRSLDSNAESVPINELFNRDQLNKSEIFVFNKLAALERELENKLLNKQIIDSNAPGAKAAAKASLQPPVAPRVSTSSIPAPATFQDMQKRWLAEIAKSAEQV
jgi:uncharacterized membrane-anchored protein YhcB (DUF1043 family)